MKTKLASVVAALVAASLTIGADAPKPACCADEKPALAACCAELKPAAPLSSRSIYQLDTKWTNDAGQPMALAALRGRPVAIAMFFASCEYACPVLVSDIKRLRAALPEAVREKTQLVLVSFDTARDTPGALKIYRERSTLDAGWTLLRGDESSVQELAMLLGVKFKQDARGQFAHSNLITILNAEGEIVHQQAGLQGDISVTAQKVLAVAK
ncbi:MAG: SCO family protein [Opitutaceae bacterium]